MLEFENILNHYLTNDIPLALMDDFYELNLRQRGFMMNRIYDYSSKEDSIGEIINADINIGVSDNYLLMSHDITEETPLSPEEQLALFREKEELEKKIQVIEQEVNLEDLPFIKNINLSLAEFDKNDLNLAIEIHDLMNDKIELDSDLNEKNEIIDEEEVRDTVMKKYKLDDYRLNYFIELYAKYISLLTSKKDFIQKIASKNIDEYSKLKEKYNNVLDTLTKKNVKLANWVVRKYFKYIPAEMEEMQAFALEGLAVALQSYNYKLGYRFSTLAVLVIRHRIQRHFKLLTGITWNNYLCVCRYNQALNTYQEVMESDERVSVEDLYNSNLFGISFSELAKGEFFSQFLTLPFSNILPVDPLDLRDRKNEILKTMDDYEDEDVYEDYVNNKLGLVDDFEDELFISDLNILRENIDKVLSTLTEREEKVLRLRFGLDDGQERTLEQVANIFNLTRERIRQMEAKALRKLRHPSRSKLINIFSHEGSNRKISSNDDYPEWVTSLKNQSDAKILSMMLTDYITNSVIFLKYDRKLAWKYGVPYELGSPDIEKVLEEYIEKFFMVLKKLGDYESYSNVYEVKSEVEEETKIILPVEFYLDYFHKVKHISAKRR